jgi:8-oxo-dGTP diphosphatase
MTTIIRKVGAIIQDSERRLLVVKKNVPGRNTYIIPGGRPEANESEEETLRRELLEELGIQVESFKLFGKFEEPAEFEDAKLVMTVFDVRTIGTPIPQSEIIDAIWIDSGYSSEGIGIGSTLANHVVPRLVELGRM